jgi:hypothetical protein
MQLTQIIPPCHTGWPDPIPIRVIQVGQCTWPESFLRGIRVGRIQSYRRHTGWPDPIPILVIQVSQPSWLKSFLCAIHVGQYSFPQSFLPCHTNCLNALPKPFLNEQCGGDELFGGGETMSR